MTDQAGWYDLKRAKPKFDPSQKDQWSMLAKNCEEALSCLEREPDLRCRLLRCEDDALPEFWLEQRELLHARAGVQRGKFVDTFPVRRA